MKNEAFTLHLGVISRKGKDLTAPHGGLAGFAHHVALYLHGQQGLQAFTISMGLGYWEGAPEAALQIYISDLSFDAAQGVARDLAETFDQDCVGVVPAQKIILVDNPNK